MKKVAYLHFKGYEDLVNRTLDLMKQSDTYYRCSFTSFLTPDQIDVVQRVVGKANKLLFYGGYEQAEMKVACIAPIYEENITFPIVALSAKISKQYSNISHRDILGAFMHCGIKRSQFGDLCVLEDKIVVFVKEEIADYICMNVTKIKRTNISFEVMKEALIQQQNVKEVTKIVSGLRLDILVSSFCQISRTKAQSLILSGSVKVNYIVLEETSFLCNNDSTISIRGYGRFCFKEVTGRTKKGNYVILVDIFR